MGPIQSAIEPVPGTFFFSGGGEGERQGVKLEGGILAF
jgi:hypothetical protein